MHDGWRHPMLRCIRAVRSSFLDNRMGGRAPRGREQRQMSNFGRNLALWVIIALLLVVLFNLFQPSATHTAATQVAYSDFINEVNGGRVRDVVMQGRTVSGQLTDGRTFQTYTPEDSTLVQRLTDKGVRVIAKPEDSDV